MSKRSLIEFNHDVPLGDTGLLVALERYRCSGSREAADHLLANYGVRVIGMRHHSGTYIMDGTPDGFPPQYLVNADAK